MFLLSFHLLGFGCSFLSVRWDLVALFVQQAIISVILWAYLVNRQSAIVMLRFKCFRQIEIISIYFQLTIFRPII